MFTTHARFSAVKMSRSPFAKSTFVSALPSVSATSLTSNRSSPWGHSRVMDGTASDSPTMRSRHAKCGFFSTGVWTVRLRARSCEREGFIRRDSELTEDEKKEDGESETERDEAGAAAEACPAGYQETQPIGRVRGIGVTEKRGPV